MKMSNKTITGLYGFKAKLGMLFLMLSPYRFLLYLQRKASVTRFTLKNNQAFLISSPDIISQVLGRGKSGAKKSSMYVRLKPLLGDGLILKTGDEWVQSRSRAQEWFRSDALAGYQTVIEEAANDHFSAARFDSTGAINIDGAAAGGAFALDVAIRLFFGQTDHLERVVSLNEKVKELNSVAGKFGRDPRVRPLEHPSKLATSFRELTHQFELYIGEWLDRTIESNQPCLALSIYNAIGDKSAAIEELKTFFFAGHDTTGNGIAWTLMLLAAQPEAQEMARASVGQAGWTYLDQCIAESMRLFPPVFVTSRELTEPLNFDGGVLPVGSIAMISPYSLHRNPDYWDSPEEFKPERFSDGVKKFSVECRYLPFSRGARSCIGERLAWMEMRTAIGVILSNYKISKGKAMSFSAVASLSMQPKRADLMLSRL